VLSSKARCKCAVLSKGNLGLAFDTNIAPYVSDNKSLLILDVLNNRSLPTLGNAVAVVPMVSVVPDVQCGLDVELLNR
jgi:hypothetical protein